MIKAVVHTQKYFQAPKDYFWRWAENGEVIEWSNGNTICYRDDLVMLLRELSASGLPSFGSLLLLLAACKEPLHLKDEFFLLRTLKHFGENNELKNLYDNAVRFIHIVNALPAELKTGKARTHLINEVFEGTGFVFSNQKVKEMIDELNSGRIDQLILERTEEITKEQFAADLKYLNTALVKYPTIESLVLRLRTGLNILPQAAEIVLPETSPPDLLDQLAEDPKTLGVSRLAKRLVAALNIPMHSSISGDQSYGGITDITNRGNYDKLLLSELAHDNDVLIARLVNNEALYFRREEPPDNPKRQRTILVDTTLKMWGIPRVFAISAGLAFTYNTKHKEIVESYALGGKAYKEIQLDTKDGVIASLEILDHSLHCGAALKKVIEDINTTEYNEFIFITDQNIFNNPDFHAGLSEVKQALGFILTVSRDGHAWFYECKKGRTKLLSTAKFDLEELLFNAPKIVKIKKAVVDERIPAFLLQTPPPLLFPKVRIKTAQGRLYNSGEFGVIAVNESQRVLQIPGKGKGAYELLNYIEKGTYSFGVGHPADLYIIVNNYQRKLLKFYHINQSTFAWSSVNLSDEIQFGKHIVYHQNKFYIRTDHASFSFNCHSKEVEDKKEYGGFSEIFNSARSTVLSQTELSELYTLIYPYDNTMYKIREMYLSEKGKLVMGNYTLDFVWDDHNLRVTENVAKKTGTYYSKEVSMSRSMLKNKSIKFAIRKWDDGSEAIIDSRGFLHLKSSDPTIPEISIVLVTGAYTGCWASDGIAGGSSYFIDRELANVIPIADFYKKYIQRFIDRLMKS